MNLLAQNTDNISVFYAMRCIVKVSDMSHICSSLSTVENSFSIKKACLLTLDTLIKLC